MRIAIHLLCVVVVLGHNIDLSSSRYSGITPVSKDFVSVALDMFIPGREPSTINTGLLSVDFNNPQFREYTRQLAPGILRVGGSDCNGMIFQDLADPSAVECVPGYTCLNSTRVDQLFEFAEYTGLRVLLCVNERYGNRPKMSPHFNTTNLVNLLTYLKPKAKYLAGFTLGNEMNHKLTAKQIASDYIEFRSLIQDIFPTDQLLLLGPDGHSYTMWREKEPEWFKEFVSIAHPVIDAVSYHMYAMGSGRNPEDIRNILINSTRLDHIRELASMVSTQVHEALPTKATDIWVTESASVNNRGKAGVSNTFWDSFWYAEQLGVLHDLGHKVFARQTLIGGDYEMIDHLSWLPNPDYYIALLWKRVMLNFSWKVEPFSPDVRVHMSADSGESPNVIGLVFINLNIRSHIRFSLTNTPAGFSHRSEYHVTPVNGNFSSQTVLVNEYPSDHFIPVLSNVNDDVLLSPGAITFIQLRK